MDEENKEVGTDSGTDTASTGEPTPEPAEPATIAVEPQGDTPATA